MVDIPSNSEAIGCIGNDKNVICKGGNGTSRLVNTKVRHLCLNIINLDILCLVLNKTFIRLSLFTWFQVDAAKKLMIPFSFFGRGYVSVNSTTGAVNWFDTAMNNPKLPIMDLSGNIIAADDHGMEFRMSNGSIFGHVHKFYGHIHNLSR